MLLDKPNTFKIDPLCSLKYWQLHGLPVPKSGTWWLPSFPSGMDHILGLSFWWLDPTPSTGGGNILSPIFDVELSVGVSCTVAL